MSAIRIEKPTAAAIVAAGAILLMVGLLFAVLLWPRDSGVAAAQAIPAAAQTAATPAADPVMTREEAGAAFSDYILQHQARIKATEMVATMMLSKIRQDIEYRNLDRLTKDAETLKDGLADAQHKLSQIAAPMNVIDADGPPFEAVHTAAEDIMSQHAEVGVSYAVYAHVGIADEADQKRIASDLREARRAFRAAAIAGYKHFGIPLSRVDQESLVLK